MAKENDDGAAPKKRGRVENLSIIKDSETARARGKLGGVASGKARQQRKLVSQIIAQWLAKDHEVPSYNPITGKVEYKTMTTDELMDHAMVQVLSRGDAASGSMLKILSEINEGKTINLPGLTLDLTPEQRAERIAELEALRNAKKKAKK
jgi:hypothetical protein